MFFTTAVKLLQIDHSGLKRNLGDTEWLGSRMSAVEAVVLIALGTAAAIAWAVCLETRRRSRPPAVRGQSRREGQKRAAEAALNLFRERFLRRKEDAARLVARPFHIGMISFIGSELVLWISPQSGSARDCFDRALSRRKQGSSSLGSPTNSDA